MLCDDSLHGRFKLSDIIEFMLIYVQKLALHIYQGMLWHEGNTTVHVFVIGIIIDLSKE